MCFLTISNLKRTTEPKYHTIELKPGSITMVSIKTMHSMKAKQLLLQPHKTLYTQMSYSMISTHKKTIELKFHMIELNHGSTMMACTRILLKQHLLPLHKTHCFQMNFLMISIHRRTIEQRFHTTEPNHGNITMVCTRILLKFDDQ